MKNIIHYIKSTIAFFAIVLALFSCNWKNVKNNHNLRVQSLNVISKNDFVNKDFIKSIRYIKLSTTDPKSLFTQIDKIKIKNKNIYLLDATDQHFVYVFDMDGDFIQRIGQKGKGPGEYSRLYDFDVDEKGNIYLLEMQKRRIIEYDKRGKLIMDKQLPFRADAFNFLYEKNYIFSLKNISTNPDLNTKIIITDSSFNIKLRYFTYDKNYLDDKGNTNIFQETKSGLLYNKPVNDTMYIFNKNGEITDAFYFDFGNKTVPQELKNSYEKLGIEREKRNFEYFNHTPLLIKNFIIGNIFSDFKKAFILYDLNTGKTFQHELSEENFYSTNINFPMSVFDDSTVVSYLDAQLYGFISDKSNLSSDIQSHLQNGGTVLSIYSIK